MELRRTLISHQPPRRVSPGQVAILQGRLDQVMATIDQIVKSTCSDGQPLLAGGWRVTGTTDSSVLPHRVACMTTKALGCGPKARLCDLQSGGSQDLFHASLVDVCEIITRAADQVSFEQRRLASFQSHPTIASGEAGQVATENRAAAGQATADLDLVLATSQLTQGYLLAVAQSQPLDR